MSKVETLFNWYGGKQKLAREIISMMPDHKHYVEVFFGSGAIFFNKPRAPINTINDFNENLVNLYIQVRDNFDKLSEKVYWTLHSRRDYENFMNMYNNDFKDVDPVMKALAFYFIVKASFQSQVGQGFHPSVKNSSASFHTGLIENMRTIRLKLDGVVIENETFSKILPKFDDPSVLFYCDPPYFDTHEKMYYEHELARNDHEYLCYFLLRTKAKWILSYDSSEAVLDMYKDFNIRRVKTWYNARGVTKRVEELIITNYKPKHAQMDVFDAASIEMTDISEEEHKRAEWVNKLKMEKESEEKFRLEKEQETPLGEQIDSGAEEADAQQGLFD